MATRPMKTITGLPGQEENTYTFLQLDNTLAVAGKAADAKKTGQEIADLKSAFNNSILEGSYMKSMWEDGSISSSSGANTSTNPLIRTIGYLPHSIIEIDALTGYEYRVYKYNSSGTFIGILKTDGTFSTGTTDGAFVTHYSPDYSTGEYKLVLFKTSSHSAEVTVNDSENVIFMWNKIERIEADISNCRLDITNVKEQLGDIKYNPVGTVITPESVVTGKYVTGNIGEIISVGNGSSYSYGEYNVSEGDVYWVRTRVGTNSTYHHYIYIVDSTNKVLKMYAEYLESSAYMEYIPITIPVDASKMYVMSNASTGYLGEVKNTESESIQEQIDSITLEKKCYVDATASAGGDGTEESPFNTLSEPAGLGFNTFIVASGEYAPFTIENATTVRISLWEMPVYSAEQRELPKIVIKSSGGTGVVIQNCRDVYLSDIHVEDIVGHSFLLQDISRLECVRCYASGNIVEGAEEETLCGFKIKNVNGTFIECKAWDIDLDGFNIHGYGSTTFINCIAHDCQDDGLSHHDGCTGAVIGGEYYNCDKGGISSPTHGAIVDVNGAYCHDNTRHGIHVSGETTSGKISNCVCKDNGQYDFYVVEASVVAWNNVYDTKYIGDTANVIEY